ncbi:deneddylase [Thalictrum thalictroides]|uniref:Deneddylase n=1 Tax=Thalictrum thalictroides TaxID=46969 RepID=A0A7J6WJE5_THATH|nr:deneddylase [Thalictrum thalictroides]
MSFSLLHSSSKSPLPLSFHKSLSFPQNPIFFSKTPLKPLNQFLTISSCSSSNSLPSSEQDILQSIAKFDENNPTTSLPAARTYENDLGRLSLVGTVAFEQALTAAAADGGEAADEHINADMSSMVVETVFPGPLDEKSTISTRLFLPSRKVKEKARKLRSTLPADMLSSTTSRNILAMTFRQVVLQHIWSFELQLFGPGPERNMEDLENPREEVPATFTLSSSDERVLSVLSEAVSMYALESTEMDFRAGSLVTASKSFFSWFQKPRKIASKDFSVVIYQLAQDELVQNAKIFFKNFNKMETSIPGEMKSKYRRWMSSTYKNLEKIVGPEFIEYVPAYKLEIDANILKNIKLEGWKKSAENKWEVLLTHSQMVELADILDMYYEDVYTIPDKQLSCGVVTNFAKLSKNKNNTSLWKKLVITLVGGLFVVSVGTLAQVYRSHLYGARKSPGGNFTVPVSETECYLLQNVDESELQSLSTTIIKKIKDGVGWPGEIKTETNLGVWTGELPNYLKKLHDVNEDFLSNTGSVDTIYTGDGDAPSQLDMSNTVASPSDQVSTDMTSVQDIASYQVVLSKDGTVVGFQPTSRVAVNHWASNPLAKELYNGRKLTPGFIEPGLKIRRPDKIILIELLMSVNSDSWFALARPIRETH